MALGDRQLRYSICITHKNNLSTVTNSLDSIIGQIDENFEVVVVDSKSNDGSAEVLRRYQREGKIKLIEQKCSRGKGRQIAFEESKGDLVISNLDTDEVYAPRLKSLLEIYGKLPDDSLLLAISDASKERRGRQNITIGTRRFLQEIGGWIDVNYAEDWDLWRRAAERNRFSVVVFPLVTRNDPSTGRSSRRVQRLRFRYTRYVSMIQLGRSVFDRKDKISYAQRGIYLVARLATLFKPKFAKGVDFDEFDPKFLAKVDSESNY
jgi:glycosyltransferase involved in cell wall biosynthesis